MTPGAGVKMQSQELRKVFSKEVTKRQSLNIDNPNTRVETESGEEGWGNLRPGAC